MSPAVNSDPALEIYCAEEGFGPWWVPRALGHTRSSVRTFVAGLTGERYSDLVVAARTGRVEWHESEGWWFTLDPDEGFAVWEVSQA